ncbi:unnamed protein product, partial [Ectocarpus sp. 12 AP-2014]
LLRHVAVLDVGLHQRVKIRFAWLRRQAGRPRRRRLASWRFSLLKRALVGAWRDPARPGSPQFVAMYLLFPHQRLLSLNALQGHLSAIESSVLPANRDRARRG